MKQDQDWRRYQNEKDKQQNNFQFTRFNLCFNYSKPKPNINRKQLTPIISAPPSDDPPQPPIEQLCQQTSHIFSQTRPEYAYSRSTTFYKNNSLPKNKEPSKANPENSQMQYIRFGFPERKKKTGQQQFLKLLMKFSNNYNPGAKSQLLQTKKKPLLQQNLQKKGISPKLRVRTRLNWVKDRYCANRDKEMGIFSLQNDKNKILANYKDKKQNKVQNKQG